jgi:hypothetical protein
MIAVSTTALVYGTYGVTRASGAITETKAMTSAPVSYTSKTPQTKIITYTIEGMKQSVKANLFASSQGYGMYVLQGFQASGEEPSKDIVMSRHNSNNYMRIEKLPAKVNMVGVRTNVVASLKAVGKVNSVNPKSFSDVFFRNALFAYHATGKKVDQTAIVMKIQGDFYRIVITTQKETESIAPYFAMIKTIEPYHKNPGQCGNTGIVAGALVTSIINQGVGEDGSVNFVIQVKNQTEQVQELTFNTGQRYDYILSKDGKELERYSRGKMFTQLVEVVTLKQGEELKFPIQLSGLTPGHYHLDAWITYAGWSDAAKSKASIDFDVQ